MTNAFDHSFESMLAQSNLIATKYTSHISGNKILNFSYNEIRGNGDFLVLNNNESFLQTLIETDVCLEMPGSIFKSHPHVGFYLLDLDNPKTKEIYKPFSNTCEKFGYAHTLRFVKIDVDPVHGVVIKRFGLEAANTNNEANDFYLNNLPIITNFFNSMDNYIKTLKDTITPIQTNIAPAKINQYVSHNQKPASPIIRLDSEGTEENAPETNSLENVYLTNRELEVLEWLQKGKTAEETAIILGRSRRTIESHFAKMRQKFKCHSKYIVLKHINLSRK